MSQNVISIKQLANRLQNGTSAERVDALENLNSLTKSFPTEVGQFALSNVLEVLKEQATIEEYQECLDIIYRLLKTKNEESGKNNASIILQDKDHIELFLDLLQHSDLTVGVMTSQILTELHLKDSTALEALIQECPDGMNKLLQQLPDNSREEVRNQAIVLVQQLTLNNEEMKKTVAFNEGFDILFNIIKTEGGSLDAGLVVQDCLQICNNILLGSETCQRFFFGMGSDWILRLADFFDPLLLESTQQSNTTFETSESDPSESISWYDSPIRLSCASLALSALWASISVENKKHQSQLIHSNSLIVSSAAFWIARKGPRSVLGPSLSLLYKAVHNNSDVANFVFNTIIKVTPVQPGKNFPVSSIPVPSLIYGWKHVPNDDRRFIALPSLLAERYIYPSDAWSPLNDQNEQMTISLHPCQKDIEFDCNSHPDVFSTACLEILDRIFRAESTISDLIIQYILAPPPPPGMGADPFVDSMADSTATATGHFETMRPLGSLILDTLLQGCNRFLGNQYGTNTLSQDILPTERSGTLLTLIFVHGSQLCKELATALTTNHVSAQLIPNGNAGNMGGGGHRSEVRFILPLLLSMVGRMMRLVNNSNGGGTILMNCLLRLLSVVASECERAVKQILEDPSNLFVVDLATVSSESAGVPASVQILACFFLGCCFQSLSNPDDIDKTIGTGPEAGLTKRSMMQMVDSKVGLNRFMELLKKPTMGSNTSNTMHGNKSSSSLSGMKAATGTSTTLSESILVTKSFTEFYMSRVESIRSGVFEYYAGTLAKAEPGSFDVAQQRVIEMLKDEIKELKVKLLKVDNESVGPDEIIQQLRTLIEEKDKEIVNSIKQEDVLLQENKELADQLQISEEKQEQCLMKVGLLETENQEMKQKMQSLQEEMHLIVEGKSREIEELTNKIRSLEKDLMAMEIEVHDQMSRATTAENRVIELSNEVNSLISKSPPDASFESSHQIFSDEILSLKQIILKESQEKKLLQEKLDQREQKIDLLTSELESVRLPDGQNEIKINNLESRNSELKQQVWMMEDEIKQLQDALEKAKQSIPSPTDTAMDQEKEVEEFVNLVNHLFNQFVEHLEIEIDDGWLGASGEIDVDLRSKLNELIQNAASFHNRVDIVMELVDQCTESICQSIDRCSDVANGCDIKDLIGAEGSIRRVVDCVEKMGLQMHGLSRQVIESNEILAEMESELEKMTWLRNNASDENLDLNEELKEANAASVTMEERIEWLENELDKLKLTKSELEALVARHANDLKIAEEKMNLIMQDFVSDRNQLSDELKQSVDELRQQQKRNESLQLKLDDLVTSNYTLRTDVDVLFTSQDNNKNNFFQETGPGPMKEKVGLLSPDDLQLRSELEKLRKVMNQMEEELKVSNTDREKLQMELNLKEIELEERQLKLDGLDSKLNEMITNYERIEKGWDAERNTLNQQTTELLSHKNSIQDENLDLVKKLNDLQKEMDDMGNRPLRGEDGKDEVRHLSLMIPNDSNHAIQTYRPEQHLLEEISRLKNILEGQTESWKQKELEMQEDLQSAQALKAELVMLQNESKEMAADYEREIESYVRKDNEWSDKWMELNNEKEELEQEVLDLGNEMQEMKKVQEENHTQQLELHQKEMKELVTNTLQQCEAKFEGIIASLQMKSKSDEDHLISKENELNKLMDEVTFLRLIQTKEEKKFFEEKVELEKKCKELLRETLEMESEKTKKDELLRSLAAKCDGYEKKMKEMERLKTDFEEERLKVQVIVRNQLEIISDLEKKLDSAKKENDLIVEETVQLKKEFENLKIQKELELSNALVNFNATKSLTDQNEKKISELYATMAMLEKEKVDLLNDRIKSENELLAKMNADRQFHENEKHLLMNELSELRSQLTTAEHWKQEIMKVSSELDALRRSNLEIVTELDAKNEELKHFQMERDSLTKSVEQEKSTLQSLLESMEVLKENEWNAKLDLHRCQQELHDSKVSLQVNQLRLEPLEKVKEELQKEITEKIVKMNNLSIENEDMKALQMNLMRENEMLRKKLKELEVIEQEFKERTMDLTTFKAHDDELRRLAMSADKLAKSMNEKEHELSNALGLLKRREGEVMGVLSTLEAQNSELDALRAENLNLSKKSALDYKQLKEFQREIESLKSSLELEKRNVISLKQQLLVERSKSTEIVVAPHQSYRESHLSTESFQSEYAVVVELHLAELYNWMVRKNEELGKVRPKEEKSLMNHYGLMNQHDKMLQKHNQILMWIEKLKNEMKVVLENVDEKVLYYKQQINATTSQHNKDADIVYHTPFRSMAYRDGGSDKRSRSSNPRRNLPDEENDELKMLNSELRKEKRRLRSIEEKHKDLLELLAQQEEELSVFRNAIVKQLGHHAADNVQLSAQKKVIEKYGTYTNFRSSNNHEDIDF